MGSQGLGWWLGIVGAQGVREGARVSSIEAGRHTPCTMEQAPVRTSPQSHVQLENLKVPIHP